MECGSKVAVQRPAQAPSISCPAAWGLVSKRARSGRRLSSTFELGVPVQPVVARPQGIGVAKGAPHPNAARLFSEYVMSAEGQKLFESMGRTPARTTSQSNSFRFTLIDPVTVLDESAKWEKVWNDLFVKR